MKIKRSKVITHIKCKVCGVEGNVWCGYLNNIARYYCKFCYTAWDSKKELIVRILKNRVCNFYGPWLEDEINSVVKAMDNGRGDLGWYKGRYFYTTWKIGDFGVFRHQYLCKLIQCNQNQLDLLEK